MAHPVPPQVEAARRHLDEDLKQADQALDSATASWAEIEKSVIKLLGGPFRIEQPEHQLIALGLAGIFADRLEKEAGAFWFPNRDAQEGASLGFPDAVIVL